MFEATIITSEGEVSETLPLGLFFSKEKMKKAGREYISLLLRANPSWFFVHKREAENILYSASNNQAKVEIVVSEIPIGDSSNIPYACACC